MIYDVRHKTTFTYEDMVSVSHHVLHLVPRLHERQTTLATGMVVDPSPAVDSHGKDYFGNPVQYLTVQEPHERLVVDAHSRVEVRPTPVPLVLEASERWEEVRARLATDVALEAYEFSFESPRGSAGRA